MARLRPVHSRKRRSATTPTPSPRPWCKLAPKRSVSENSEATMDHSVFFMLPSIYRSFRPFPRLPPELRLRIWELSLDTPGVHFLKLAYTEESITWVRARNNNPAVPVLDEDDHPCTDVVAWEVIREHPPHRLDDVRLVPSTENPKADPSYYKATRRHLAVLLATSRESQATAKNILAKQRVLRLDDNQVLTLPQVDDVIFLEYLPRMDERTGQNYTIDPNLPVLHSIRRLAVRFCHDWSLRTQNSGRRCLACGHFHSSRAGAEVPVHLYQFMARNLPALRQFYFVDYFMLRKSGYPPNSPGVRARICKLHLSKDRADEAYEEPVDGTRIFYGTDRALVEANNGEWCIDSAVTHTIDWLQDRFVRYANKSRYSLHNNPEQVSFGILGCEWDSTYSPKRRTFRSIHPLDSSTTSPSYSSSSSHSNSPLYSLKRHSSRERRPGGSYEQGQPLETLGEVSVGPVVFEGLDNASLYFPFTFRSDYGNHLTF